jgi:NAD(P)-dependent dehydrogenase (short-subunit alcohol dehydrogenase family)
MGISGQRVVVIGGTSGIGQAVAQAVAGAGGTAIVASSGKEHVDEAVATIGGTTEGYRVDVTDEDSIRALFDQVGEFDHLVYTAGAHLLFKPIGEMTMAEARGSFDVRFWGAFAAAKYGTPRMRPGGSIVFTSGVICTRPAANLTGPVSATGAIEALARALSVEIAPLRVNVVRLGPVGRKRSPGTSEADHKALYQQVSDKLLIKRMGSPAEAAAGYLHLMENGFAIGTVFTLDGGYVLV